MSGQPKIDSYGFGRIEIDGQVLDADVIILPTGVRTNWWRAKGHDLKPDDLAAVVEAQPEVLVIGQGAYSRMQVTEGTLAYLKEAGIRAVCLPTEQAVDVYNDRAEQDETVAAALHLTC